MCLLVLGTEHTCLIQVSCLTDLATKTGFTCISIEVYHYQSFSFYLLKTNILVYCVS